MNNYVKIIVMRNPTEIRGHAFVPVTEDFDGCF